MRWNVNLEKLGKANNWSTLPNLISLLRIALIPLLVFFLLRNFFGLAAGLFLLLALSDAVDGFLARYLKQTSELGKFLDPLADKILVVTALIALVSLKLADSVAVMIITARELSVSGIRIEAARLGKIIAATDLAKWKTISQIVAVLMLTLNLPYANLVLWLAVILSVGSGIEYLGYL